MLQSKKLQPEKVLKDWLAKGFFDQVKFAGIQGVGLLQVLVVPHNCSFLGERARGRETHRKEKEN